MPASADDKCPRCNDDLIPHKMFCPSCGQALAPPDHKSAIDSYVVAKVEQELKLRTKDDDAVVRDVAFKAENEAIARLKRYWWIGAAVISLGGILLGLIGIASIQDAKRTIVSEAKSRVEPVVSDVENRAKAAQASLSDVEKRLPGVTKSLNDTSKVADQQRLRVEGQSAEIAAKIKNYERAASSADELAAAFQARADDAQRRLADMARRYETSLTQVSRAVVHTSMAAAFPGLDDKRFLSIGPVRFDVTDKKPGEKWVNVYLTGNAISAHVIGQKPLEDMGVELTAAGMTVLPGLISFGGAGGGLIERAGPGSFDESSVIYFRPSFKASAVKINSIVSKYVRLAPGSPPLVESGEGRPMRGGVDFISNNGKLDAQIFISAPPQ
jgi:hypothetical protein